MKFILLVAALAAQLYAQQSLSSPITVGGVNCGEIRLREAFSTGTSYSTIKTCRNAFSRLENTFVDGSGTTYLSMDAAGLKQIQSVAVRNTITSGNVAQMYVASGGSGTVDIFTNTANSATIRLEGKYAGTSAEAGLSMFADAGNETLTVLGGTAAGTAARLSIKTSAGALGFFASGAGSASLYNAGTERIRLAFSTGLTLYDASGNITHRSQDNWFDLQQLAAPGNPAAGYIRTYAKTSTGQLCTRDSAGTETCYGAGAGSYVDTTSNQSIAGNKYTTGAWRGTEIAVRATSGAANVWQSYITSGAGITEVWPSGSASFATAQLTGNYSAGGTAALLLLDPASGAERVRIQGGSASVNPVVAIDRSVGAQARLGADSSRGGYLELYDTGPTVRVKLNTSTSNGLQILDASGNSRIVMDGSGTGGAISSAGTSFTISQSGDSLGSSSLTLYNRSGQNGAVITSGTNDLAEFQLQGSAGTNRTVRMEGRSNSWLCGLSTAEIQMGYTDSVGGFDFGLIATRMGSCIPKSYPMRWMGSSSGYAALKAPATVTSYTLDLPNVIGSTGQCLYMATSSALGWTSCGGGGSYVDTTSNQSIAGNKYTSNAWRGAEIAVRSNSTAGNVWQSYLGAGGQGISEVWSSTSSATPTSQWTGNYASSGYAALTFNLSSTGAELIRIGGTSGNGITLYGSGGSGTGVSMAGNASGGTFSVYDSTSQEVVRISGASNRVWTGATLATGYTGSISTGSCTISVTRGWVTGTSGTC